MSRATTNLASLSNNSVFRQDVVEESFKELGRRIERGAYYEKGRKEGEIKGKIEGLAMLLKIRFEERVVQCMPKIRSIQDLDKLNSLLSLAMNAQNIEEFGHALSDSL